MFPGILGTGPTDRRAQVGPNRDSGARPFKPTGTSSRRYKPLGLELHEDSGQRRQGHRQRVLAAHMIHLFGLDAAHVAHV